MPEKSPVFKTILDNYLSQVAALEPRRRLEERLGVRALDDRFEIPFFHRTYTIGSRAVTDSHGVSANHAVAVILCNYLLLCPQTPEGDQDLVTYKDFKDAAPYVAGFRNTAERPIARSFSGNADFLPERCGQLGGKPFDTEVSCDRAFRFDALPRIPVFLLFNDADDEFPADCTLLFQKDAAAYLDMECIAMIGSALAAWLQGK